MSRKSLRGGRKHRQLGAAEVLQPSTCTLYDLLQHQPAIITAAAGTAQAGDAYVHFGFVVGKLRNAKHVDELVIASRAEL